MKKLYLCLLIVFAIIAYFIYRGMQETNNLPINQKNPTAICRDGHFSYSLHRQGTCSGHGGVGEWK